MRSSQAVVVFVEVHHLKAVELCRDLLDLLLLSGLNRLNALGIPGDSFQSETSRSNEECEREGPIYIPLDVCARSRLVLASSLLRSTGGLASMDVLHNRARHDG